MAIAGFSHDFKGTFLSSSTKAQSVDQSLLYCHIKQLNKLQQHTQANLNKLHTVQ